MEFKIIYDTARLHFDFTGFNRCPSRVAATKIPCRVQEPVGMQAEDSAGWRTEEADGQNREEKVWMLVASAVKIYVYWWLQKIIVRWDANV